MATPQLDKLPLENALEESPQVSINLLGCYLLKKIRLF